jgi:hypothetical protein
VSKPNRIFAELALIILTTSAYHNTLAGGNSACRTCFRRTGSDSWISEGTAKSFAVFSTPGVVPSQRLGQKSRMGMADHFRRPVKTARNVQFVFETALAIAIGATSPNFSNRRFRDAGLSAIVGARAVDRRHREE